MQFIKVRDVKTPARGTNESAGLDFFIPEDVPATVLRPGESINIPSGIKMILPAGKAGVFMNKSGVGKYGILVGACVVDSDYRGEVHLNVVNTTQNLLYRISPGKKLVQMVVLDVDLSMPQEITQTQFDLQSITQRGTGGFGSTGA